MLNYNHALRKLFIGIPISSLLTQEIIQQTSDIKVPFIKWTHPENLHVTACFIGHVEESKLSDIKVALLSFTFPSFSLHPKEIIPIYRKGKVDMIWLTFEPSDKYSDLSFSLHQILGMELVRAPLAHVTLGRVKAHPKNSFPQFHLKLNTDLKLEVEKLILYESNSQGNGSTYIPLTSISLK